MEDIITEHNAEEKTEDDPRRKALAVVNRDFKRAKTYLKSYHNECVERYKHYRAQGLAKNILKDNSFPVPFTCEQVDQLRSDMMEKLWYKDQPCGIYGRNDTDKADADAKREFMQYQDREDKLYEKTDHAILHCALYGMAPAVVNYREDKETRWINQDVPVTDENDQPILDIDGQTPLMTQQMQPQEVVTYQGASVELVDPIDFFWTPEKREPYDEYAMMVRSKRSMDWLKERPYIDSSALAQLENDEFSMGSDEEDLLSDRRNLTGYDTDNDHKDGEIEYVEWQGWYDFGEGKDLYIVGMVNGKVVVRLEKGNDIFRLGHPNIVIGLIDSEFGEMRGQSLLDKIHSIQHALDTMFGIWIKNMKQSVNKMWVVNTDKMKVKKLVNEPGFVINTRGNPNEVVKEIEPSNISSDIYNGLEMLRQMGQNSSGMSDIVSGVVQEGVETLGEANIVSSQGGLRIKRYLKTFEDTFIKPVYEMRNQVNQVFVTDPGYLFSVIEDKIMAWRTISPEQIRSNVDFMCEASNRENERMVITQQILQALNLVNGLIPVIGPMPAIMLLQKLYEDAFGWSEDEIAQLLPLEPIMASMAQNQMMQQAQMQAKQAPGEMSQPTSEGDAIQSAQQQSTPDVGAVQ